MRSNIETFSRKALLVFTALATILTAVAAANAQKSSKKPAAKGPFTGIWDTRSAGTYKYTVRLTQTGNKVIGTYTPGNGKIFGGVVVGNKVTFKWRQDGGYEGTGEFTLDDDRKGFTGSSTAIKPAPQSNTWNTYKPAPPESFAGTWDLVDSVGVRIPLTIVQNGAKVTGVYPARNGKLEGTVDGRHLRFKWESDKGSGSGHFKVSSSGETFGGSFNKGDNPDAGESNWWGERISRGNNSSEGGSGRKILGSYAGIWTSNESGLQGALNLSQSGSNVTGTYATAQGTFGLIEAHVNGTILRFKFVRKNIVQSGEVVLSQDGRSFNGTINGVSLNGTLVRPQ